MVDRISPKIEDPGKMHVFVLLRMNGAFTLQAIQ